MSTNEENKTQESRQNGSQTSGETNFFENTSPNSIESELESGKVCKGESAADISLLENEGTVENDESNLENTCNTDNTENGKTLSREEENLVEESDLLTNEESSEVENSDLNMSKSGTKSRLPNKTTSRSTLPYHNPKISGELTGQPSIKNNKDDIKYWKNREQELLSKIADLENKLAQKNSNSGNQNSVITQLQEKLENDLRATTREKENYKNRLQSIEKELCNKQKEISADSSLKNFKSSDEIINHLKVQNEDLRNALAKMTAILRDKTTMCVSQEKKIAALINQIESLKEVVAITKDLLNIRNMEVQHLSNDISAMETKIDCERQRHNQMLIKMDEAVKLNSELKKEYETQLKLFQNLRDSYEEKIILLSQENNIEKKENQTIVNETSSDPPV